MKLTRCTSLLIIGFPMYQRAPQEVGMVWEISTFLTNKTNRLPSFIDRYTRILLSLSLSLSLSCFFLAMILAISKIGGTFVWIFVFSLSWWRILFGLQSNLPCIVCTQIEQTTGSIITGSIITSHGNQLSNELIHGVVNTST